MVTLDQQMTAAGILHTYVGGVVRAHHWNSGWLQIAVGDLDGEASSDVTPTAVASVTTTTPSGAYTAGKTITIDIGFTAQVAVTGIPTLALNNGAAAIYNPSKSSGNHVVFDYTVAAVQDVAHLDYANTAAIMLPIWASIQAPSGYDAGLTLPAPASPSDGLYAAKIVVDTTAPRSPALNPASPSITGWYNISTGVAPSYTYTAVDNAGGSGLASPASGRFTFGEGAGLTHKFTVTDLAGNSASVTNAPVKVDLTNPVTTAAVTVGTPGTNGWYTSPVTVGLSATDNLSNVAATYYSLNRGKTWAPGTSVAVSAQGTTTVSYYSVDFAGNTEAVGNYTVKIDTVAPTVTAPNITTGPNEATGALVHYTGASASDLTSGVSSLTFNPPSGSHFPVGTTTVNYTAIDNAGDSSQGSFTVTVNRTGLVGSVLYVIGTSGDDAFVIDGTTASSVPITIGGVAVPGSPFSLSGGKTIHAFGNAGNDTFTISGTVGATLDGGAGSNMFTVTGYTGTGSLTGGGSDTVVASRNASFTLTSSRLTIGTQNITLAGIGTANLTGGTGNNTFTVTGWTGGGAITGGGGDDTIVISKDTDFTLADNALTTGDGMNLTLAAIGTATLTGGAAANVFDLAGWTGKATLNGAGNTDALIAERDASFVLADASLSITPADGSTARVWKLSGIEQAVLTGGTGNNPFNVSGWTGTGSLTGGGGSDTVVATKNTDMTLSSTALTAGSMSMKLSGITLGALTANNTAARVIDASAFSGSSTLIATGTGRTKLFGGSGNDTLRVTGSGPAVLVGGDGADMFEHGRQRSDDPHRRLGRRQRDQYRRRSGRPDWGQHDVRCTHRQSPDGSRFPTQ